MFTKACILSVALALSACATCEQHPAACTIGAAILAGSVAATIQHHHDQHAAAAPVRADAIPVHCVGGSCQ